jgi:hypothetical protein
LPLIQSLLLLLIVSRIAGEIAERCQELFSILVLMGAVTTLVTPFLLRNAFRNLDSERATPVSTDAVVSGVESLLPAPPPTSNHVNDPPVSNLDRITTTQDKMLTFPASDLLNRDHAAPRLVTDASRARAADRRLQQKAHVCFGSECLPRFASARFRHEPP